MKSVWLMTLVFLLMQGTVTAHPGRTDANGCHQDEATGETHCGHEKGSGASTSTTPPKSPTVEAAPRASMVSVGENPPAAAPPTDPSPYEGVPPEAFAMEVVNVRTFFLSDKTKIRLIGVDLTAPEKHSKAAVQKATAFSKQIIEGHMVTLATAEPQKDENKSTLAYVYRDHDGLFVNAEIIKRGYGRVDTQIPFERMEEFKQYELEARAAKRGLWKPANAEIPKPKR